MADREREYKPLPGRGLKRAGLFTITRVRSRLWAGKDHLLLVYNSAYTEEYKRFYYRDIQAIITRKTNRGAVWSIVMALFVILFAALSLTVAKNTAIITWIPAGVFFVALLINIMLGPTCITCLQTAVSKEDLPSLNRLRTFKKAMQKLKPLIETAQGVISPEQMRTKAAEIAKQTGIDSSSGLGGPPAPKPNFSYNGRIHSVLFYLLLMDGALSAGLIFLHHVALMITGTLLMMAITILVIIAVTRQHDSGMGKSLRNVTWASLGYTCISFVLGYVLFFYLVVTNPEMKGKMNQQWEMIRILSHLSAFEIPVLMGMYMFSIICSVPLGIAGLMLLEEFHRIRQQQKPIFSASGQDHPGGSAS